MRFVPAASLQPGMLVARNILGTTKAFVLKKGIVLTPSYCDYLNEKGYLGAYISDRVSDEVLIEEYVDQELIGQGLKAVESQNVGAIVNLATDIVSDICKRKTVSVDFFDLRAFDDYTYHHSVNVGVYAVAVGQSMGLDRDDLNKLCLAAICHDLGKQMVPIEILNKNGKLTDEEYEVIKTHPRGSFDILSEHHTIPAVVRQAVLMHHENEDGTGYPLGRESKDIPLFAKILHVVDVYDALTCKRPYKDPFAPASAVEYINSHVGMMFDAAVVEAMNTCIPAYPPGITVTLSDGREAIVITHTKNALRPKVKLLDSEEIIDLLNDPEHKDISIVSSGIMPSDYVGEIEVLNEGRIINNNRKRHILLVESDKLSRMQIKKALWGEGYELIECDSGMDAINYLKNNPKPDLLLMSIQMPGMDGLTTYERIKNEVTRTLDVIFVTSYANQEIVLECKKLGAIDFVLRPANPSYLKDRVRLAIQRGDLFGYSL